MLPEDRGAFLTEYAGALAAPRDSLDLTGLFRMLEHWRRVAALQSDPQVFRRVARRAAHLLTGQPSPEDEPLAVTRTHTFAAASGDGFVVYMVLDETASSISYRSSGSADPFSLCRWSMPPSPAPLTC